MIGTALLCFWRIFTVFFLGPWNRNMDAGPVLVWPSFSRGRGYRHFGIVCASWEDRLQYRSNFLGSLLLAVPRLLRGAVRVDGRSDDADQLRSAWGKRGASSASCALWTVRSA